MWHNRRRVGAGTVCVPILSCTYSPRGGGEMRAVQIDELATFSCFSLLYLNYFDYILILHAIKYFFLFSFLLLVAFPDTFYIIYTTGSLLVWMPPQLRHSISDYFLDFLYLIHFFCIETQLFFLKSILLTICTPQ